MRNTREILRQKWLLKRPHRAIGASVGVSLGPLAVAQLAFTSSNTSLRDRNGLRLREVQRRQRATARRKSRGLATMVLDGGGSGS
jgi:hypothetical protein